MGLCLSPYDPELPFKLRTIEWLVRFSEQTSTTIWLLLRLRPCLGSHKRNARAHLATVTMLATYGDFTGEQHHAFAYSQEPEAAALLLVRCLDSATIVSDPELDRIADLFQPDFDIGGLGIFGHVG